MKKPYVNHTNGIKSDNVVSNLEYCTARENSLLASKNGQLKTGRRNQEIIAEDIETGERIFYASQAVAAKAIGCHNSEINKALKGKRKSCHGYKFYYADGFNGDKTFLTDQENRQLSIFDFVR